MNDSLHTIAQTHPVLALNLSIWLFFVLATIIKILAPQWSFNIKLWLINLAVAGTAYFCTVYFIDVVPQAWYSQLIYLICVLAFTSSPSEVYNWCATDGLEAIKRFIASKSKSTVDSVTITKTTETTGTPPDPNKPA